MRTITDLKTRVARSGIIPIVRTHDRTLAYDVTKKLIRAGLSCVEVTLTVPAAAELIADLKVEFGDNALSAQAQYSQLKMLKDVSTLGHRSS